MTKRKSSVLTDKQSTYVDAVLQNKSKAQAVKEAGYGASVTSVHVEQSDDVRLALKEAREELAESTQYTRAKCAEMFQEAYDLAKTAAEPAAMIAATKELAKMHGFYEPETIKVQLTQSQASLQHRFRTMSREELLEIAAGRAKVIDGEYTRVS